MTEKAEKTGFDVHVSSSAMSKLLPWAIALFVGGSAGGGLTSFLEVTGAARYTENVSEDIAENKALRARIVALEAQNAQLLSLLNGATVNLEGPP